MLSRPYLLLAELTYRCPLHCPYCSNPATHPGGEELSAGEWARVFGEAARLGVVHTGLSGGEPLSRPDLTEIVKAANSAGLYTNLITSGLGFSRERAGALREAGLDNVQISFQADTEDLADSLAGAAAHARKRAAARLAVEYGFPLTLNVVLHRLNLDRVASIIALAEGLGADRLELANTQYYGWAHRNRSALLPDKSQIETATEAVAAARERLGARLDILFVASDCDLDRPKPCMNGWGRRYLTVNPTGEVLPCPTAYSIGGMRFDSVRARDLAWIWHESEAFNRFRGVDWMLEPCRSCEFREVDFGGCRCQAYLATGEAAATDPVCALAPAKEQFMKSLADARGARGTLPTPGGGPGALVFRRDPTTARTEAPATSCARSGNSSG